MTLVVKNRSRSTMTFSLPVGHATAALPSTSTTVQRVEAVPHKDSPVVKDRPATFGPVITILAGEEAELPDSVRTFGPIKRALRSRQLVEKRPRPAPVKADPPKSKPKTTKRRTRR